MSIEAMKLALKALEEITSKTKLMSYYCSYAVEIENLRTAIEQAEKQEPVAWMYEFGTDCGDAVHGIRWYSNVHWEKPSGLVRNVVPLYTAPPQREWVGLTDEELVPIYAEYKSPRNIYLAIESALRNKNT